MLPKEKPKKSLHSVKQRERLSRAMKAHGEKRSQELRDTIYNSTDDLEAAIVPKSMYLPDPIIDTLLDRFALLNNDGILDDIF